MEFNVADLIERIAGHIPEREAVICGTQRASYKHFNDSSQRFARYLLSHNIGKGDHVGIYAHNSIEWIEAMFGCYKIGAVPININYRYVEEELLYIFRDADLKAVVYDVEFSGNINHIRSRLPLLEQFIYIDNTHAASQFPAVDGSTGFTEATACNTEVHFPQRSADDLYLLYTGGTTGMPKGVVWRQADAIMVLGGGIDMYTQEAIATAEIMADRCIQPNAFQMRSLQMAPLMHGAAQWGILRALFEGGTVVLLARKSFDAHEAWQLIQNEKINVVLVTGDAMAKPLMDALQEGPAPGEKYDTSSLFAFASASAIFSPALKDHYVEHLPHVIITDNIGSSESGFTGTSIHQKGQAETNAGGPRVNPARHVVVLDEQNQLIPAGDNRIGRMAKGGYIPQAYYKDPQKSATTFITALDGKRYAVPGDMARHNSDGTITLLGRGSLCINTGGEKVYPEEVEMALKAHPSVFDCLVTATPDERFGSCVTALIQLYPTAQQPDTESLHEACKTHIARYKLPRRIYFVSAIKRTPSGKADYRWANNEAQQLFHANGEI